MSLANLNNLNCDLNLTDLSVATLKYKTASSPYIQYVCKAPVSVQTTGSTGYSESITLDFNDVITGEAQKSFPNSCVGSYVISTTVSTEITYCFVSATKNSVTFTAYTPSGVTFTGTFIYFLLHMDICSMLAQTDFRF